MQTQSVSSKTRSVTNTNANKHSMSEQAHAIFTKHYGKKSRKEIVDEFINKIGLSASSASTYYQRFLTEDTPKKARTGTSSRGRLPDESSKAGICRALYRKLAKRPRKDVLEAFIEKADLTPAGASTYYQKLKHAA